MVDKPFEEEVKASPKQAVDHESKTPSETTGTDEHTVKFVRAKGNKYQQPVATIYFRFSHRNKKNTPLTNSEQKEIVDNIYSLMTKYMTEKHL